MRHEKIGLLPTGKLGGARASESAPLPCPPVVSSCPPPGRVFYRCSSLLIWLLRSRFCAARMVADTRDRRAQSWRRTPAPTLARGPSTARRRAVGTLVRSVATSLRTFAPTLARGPSTARRRAAGTLARVAASLLCTPAPTLARDPSTARRRGADMPSPCAAILLSTPAPALASEPLTSLVAQAKLCTVPSSVQEQGQDRG